MNRRGRNEGSIYQRDDGRWVGSVSLGVVAGRRRRRVVYGATKREVQSRLHALQATVATGLQVPTDRLTVARFLADWLETVRSKLRPRTVESYASHVRIHIAPAIGAVPLAKFGPADVQRLLDGLTRARLTAQTVAHVRATLRRALDQAERWGYVSRNVARLVDAPRIVRSQVDPLTAGEVRRLLEATRNGRRYPLLVTVTATGLRSGELRGLRWSDVDLDAGVLQVRVQVASIRRRLRACRAKTARSRRTVPLPSIGVDALREHRRRQLQERLLAGSAWRGDRWGLVFPTLAGTPYNDHTLVRRLQVDLAAAGIRRQRLHDL